jgi:hypothetical protein
VNAALRPVGAIGAIGACAPEGMRKVEGKVNSELGMRNAEIIDLQAVYLTDLLPNFKASVI